MLSSVTRDLILTATFYSELPTNSLGFQESSMAEHKQDVIYLGQRPLGSNEPIPNLNPENRVDDPAGGGLAAVRQAAVDGNGDDDDPGYEELHQALVMFIRLGWLAFGALGGLTFLEFLQLLQAIIMHLQLHYGHNDD